MTIIDYINSQIDILKNDINNYDKDLRWAIDDYGKAEKISPFCSDTNLANMTAMASEIKCRKFALNILTDLLWKEKKNEDAIHITAGT